MVIDFSKRIRIRADKHTIDHFGIKFCLRDAMSELKALVDEGIYDVKTKRHIAVRVICCLG